jgi:acetylornithine/succinyldiaminopimelate/putrescine aminotransferase
MAAAGPTNQELLQDLAGRECRDATFHKMAIPLVLDKGVGSLLWDVEGNEYTDLCAGFGALPFGHNDPELLQALQSRFSGARPDIVHGLGDVFPSRDKIKLVAQLQKILPQNLSRIALAVTGSQAVELAMKTAILATKGEGMIAFSSGYHGLDFGALSVSEMEFFKAPFGSWGRPPMVTHLPFGCSPKKIADAIDAQCLSGIKTAGILVEPVQGRGGVRAAPTGWLREVSNLCRQKGVVLILDEIFAGLGRTGKWTVAHEIDADLVCLGKSLGGGMPLSACVGKSAVMDSWPESQGEALHTGTFFGHPLSCFFGINTLAKMVELNAPDLASRKGQYFLGALEEALEKSDKVKEIRGLGLMVAVEFHRPGDGARMMSALQRDGVLAIPAGAAGECISMTPALNISDELLKNSATKIASAVSHL